MLREYIRPTLIQVHLDATVVHEAVSANREPPYVEETRPGWGNKSGSITPSSTVFNTGNTVFGDNEIF